MKKTLSILILLFFLTNCSTLKTVHLIKTGKIAEDAYLVRIPFEVVHGEIIFNVSINGTNYRFVFDTGALNIISQELSDSLGIKVMSKLETIDSQGNKDILNLSKINKFTLGSLEYMNQGTAIYDLNKMQEISCFNIDGILGANSMRQSVWQIDMVKKELLITNTLDSLKIDDKAHVIPFTPQITGTPCIKVKFNGMVFEDVKFDYGSNSGLDLHSDHINSDTSVIGNNIVKSFGHSSYGLYGGKKDTIYHFAIDSVNIGNSVLTDRIITLKSEGINTLGTKILEEFIVTIDWFTNSIYMQKQADIGEIKEDHLSTFGFTARLDSNKLIVDHLFDNSPASDAGISLGDQIISVNDKVYSDVTKEEYCRVVLDGLIPEELNQVKVKFRNNNAEKEVVLEKRNLL